MYIHTCTSRSMWMWEGLSVYCFVITGAIALDSSVFGGSSIPMTGLAFHCGGNETNLLQCPMHYNNASICAPLQQAAVLCQGDIHVHIY